ncbi:N-6 DNA methylase [Vibrio sp. ZSDE26]|uniref:site-specific DNA-methyltransferase (adenine-specific) n=1 Tax=Vibrio amylolyticus TaxID=2847292 RepID=A0A9X1XKV5_9VIBR|nr:N-6 DNA methylase [Vibrio amylolyticus]MCK6263763.1 N-6 DNA methylase [Vibrio amylolyticus]
MNQLNKHNSSLREFLESEEDHLDTSVLGEMVNLDSIDVVLRECLTIEEMREAGSFFTGAELAATAVNLFQAPITFDSVVLDPTCGAGNLLIECSRRLGVESTLSKTLEKWGGVLWGYDIHESFVEATRLRIVIEALYRGVKKDCSIDAALAMLTHIKCGDALMVDSDELATVTHSIMNPPFTSWPSPRENYWKVGKVNAAGVIFDKYLRLLPLDCNISAILPDVLRSGSRYEGFRTFTSSQVNAQCNVWGRFNSKTDVDVFILHGNLEEDNQEEIAWHEDLGEYTALSERYDVCIGPLVAYRDPEEGESYPYFHPKNSPNWQTVTEPTEFRRFSGTVLEPPFVVIKRTSSPSDRYRASATIINLKEAVAIENHMIVIKPKSSTLRDCKKILKVLKSNQTNEFLNERIRLRHLTVTVIKDIPIEGT